MTTQASTNFKTEFDALVKQSYQGSSLLAGKVRTRANVNAKTYRFPKMGKGIASLRIPQTDVIPMNVTHSYADVTLVDWDASDYSAVEDLDKLAFDEKRELVMSVSKAIGRRLDQIIVNAMDTSAYATQVATSVGGTNTSLNVEKIVRAKRLMDANGVPMEGRVMLINAAALENALLETEIGSSDFNVVKALSVGELNKFAGFEFIMMEDRTNEGGIPITSTTRNCFAFHRDAVGLAMTGGIRSAVDWIAEKKSWLITSALTAGAVTIDTDGVIDVLVYEA
jgi:hypothetical protein